MKKILILLIITVAFICSSCTVSEPEKATVEFFSMDTYMTITAYGDNAQSAAEAAKSRVEELDRLLDAEDDNSELAALNKKGSAKLGKDAYYLVKQALKYNRITYGVFNPAMHPVSVLWGFVDKNYRVPTENELKSTLKLTDPDSIRLNDKTRTIELQKGAELDLGGIAKGYASVEAVRTLRQNGVTSAVINLGGNVMTLGKKPDGSSWNVAIENPGGGSYLATLGISDKAVVTSGGYERYFESDGKTYHHILNPETGSPASSGLKSVTVVCDDGTFADAMSTALFIMGEEKSREFRLHSEKPFDYILLTDDDRLLVTSGITDTIQTDQQITVVD